MRRIALLYRRTTEYTMQQNSANWLQRILPQMTAHMVATAPSGADTKSWSY